MASHRIARRVDQLTSGLCVVVVVDTGVTATTMAQCVARRLADEFRPELVHLIKRAVPRWQDALLCEPALASWEGAYADLHRDLLVRPAESTDDMVSSLTSVGIRASCELAFSSWWWTVRRARYLHRSHDLMLAISARNRRLPPSTGRLRVERVDAAASQRCP